MSDGNVSGLTAPSYRSMPQASIHAVENGYSVNWGGKTYIASTVEVVLNIAKQAFEEHEAALTQ